MIAHCVIPAKFLFAAPPPATTVVPEGFKITQLSPRHAAGSRNPIRGGGGAGGSTSAAICNAADRRVIRSYAYQSTHAKRA
jgi:hypothetical protein